MVHKIQIQGSKALRSRLPYGAIRGMAVTFKKSDMWISQVVSGKRKGNPLFIECAVKIAGLETRSKEELQKILKGYETN